MSESRLVPKLWTMLREGYTRALEEVIDLTLKQGARLCLAELQPMPMAVLARSGILQRLGREHAFASLADALAASAECVWVAVKRGFL